MTFDPAALFLLGLGWENLFEPARADELSDKQTFRCKGCQMILPRPDREKHYRRHLKEQDRANQLHRERVKRERISRLQRVRAAA